MPAPKVSRLRAPPCGPQVIIICLVVLDALLVLAELILDLKIIQPDKNNYAAQVVHRPARGPPMGSLVTFTEGAEWGRHPLERQGLPGGSKAEKTSSIQIVEKCLRQAGNVHSVAGPKSHARPLSWITKLALGEPFNQGQD